ncbi:tetraacyldisaccharide 4'-kinase, partial [Flavobacteriaceae bacterium]|nr:tetraacyldisaccharide 4'-kinase [Flavobacteriaceae bacterium]
QDEHTHQLQLDAHQHIFFSTIVYDSYIFGPSRMELKSFVKNPFVLVTGIANAKPLTEYLERLGADFEHLAFADHHFFTASDCKKMLSKQRPILTTEKDYVRLSPMIKEVFFIPISIRFLSDEDEFKRLITNQFGD